MKFLVPLIIALLVFIIARYSYQAFVTSIGNSLPSLYFKIFKVIFWMAHLLLVVGICYTFLTTDRRSGSTDYMTWFGYFVLLFVPELLVVSFLVIEDMFRGIQWISGKLNSNYEPNLERRRVVSTIALAAASIPFTSIIYGLVKGKYNYKVKSISLKFKDLPESFNGLTITQISDLHTGSFDNKEKVEHGIKLINDLKSDLVVFTGDLVNNRADEAKPWIESFSKISAPLGKYSILGNHDYGDYVNWNSEQEKRDNLVELKKHHKSMGFRLMLNESIDIEKNNEKVSLAGVENWGKPPFVQYGDINKALQSTADFRILLSHDPSHFDEQVKQHPKKVHLTLSGHTHGMQFGIDLPGIKWSPVKFKYPKWSGLYEDLDQYLYVNQGFGYLAFPGRVGMWPEITHITLLKA